MIDSWIFTLTLGAALGSGLIAGVFFAFSSFVMKALARIPPAQGMAAMQSINIVVINPLFLGVFILTAIDCAVLAVCSIFAWGERHAALMLAGSLLYMVGTFFVTMAFNVPSNNALAAADPASPSSASLWAGYVTGWTAWNHVRTIAALLAALVLTIALLSMSQGSALQ